MLNTIKMDLFRMFKAKSFYITLIIGYISLFVSMGTFRYQMDHPEVQEMLQNAMQDSGMEDLGGVGIQMGGSIVTDGNYGPETLLNGLFQGATFITLAAIFCVIIVCSEHESGFVKNVISRKGYRVQSSFSKLIMMTVYVLIQLITSTLLFLVSYRAFIGSTAIESIPAMLGYVGMQILISIALLAIIIMVCNLSRNTAISMAVGICLSGGVIALLAQLLDKFKFGITLTDYCLSITSKALPYSYDSKLYIRALCCCICYLLFGQLVSLFILKKQDVK